MRTLLTVTVLNATAQAVGFATTCVTQDATWAVEHLCETVNPPLSTGVAIIIRKVP